MTYTHHCIGSCGRQYTDTDPDAYYCEPCRENRKAIAAAVDAKLASRPKREHVSSWKAFEEAQAQTGAGSMRFVRYQ